MTSCVGGFPRPHLSLHWLNLNTRNSIFSDVSDFQQKHVCLSHLEKNLKANNSGITNSLWCFITFMNCDSVGVAAGIKFNCFKILERKIHLPLDCGRNETNFA